MSLGVRVSVRTEQCKHCELDERSESKKSEIPVSVNGTLSLRSLSRAHTRSFRCAELRRFAPWLLRLAPTSFRRAQTVGIAHCVRKLMVRPGFS